MGRPRKITRDSDQVTVRLPAGMRDEINRIAQENGRSANAEIVDRLSWSLDQSQRLTTAGVRQIVREELQALLDALENR